MKPNITKIIAVIFCSIIFASAIHAQEKPKAWLFDEYLDSTGKSEPLIEKTNQFARQLLGQPETVKGVIIIYGEVPLGGVACVAGYRNKNIVFSNLIFEILDKKLNVPKQRFLFIYKDQIRLKAAVEFWLVPPNAVNPEPTETVDYELPCCCPNIVVTGTESINKIDRHKITFTANLSGGSGETPTYNWKVSGGKSIEGQGTPTIKVDPTGAKEITATVEIGGVCDQCARTASFTSKINGNLEMVDAFGYEKSGQIRGRLDNLLKILSENSMAKGYIINYGSRADKKFLKVRRTQINEKFALRPQDLTNRVTVIDGGYREDVETELWISTDDNQKPVPSPTVDAKFVGVPVVKKSKRR